MKLIKSSTLATLKRRATVAERDKAKMARKVQKLSRLLQKAQIESFEFRIHLFAFYHGVVTLKEGNWRKRVGLFKDFFFETGTTPGVFRNPELRALAQESWDNTMAMLKVKCNYDGEIIFREIYCDTCESVAIVATPDVKESTLCSRCGKPLTW